MRKKIIPFGSSISFAFLMSVFLLPFSTYADVAPNIIGNPGLEILNSGDAIFPEHWSTGSWGVNNAIFTYPELGGDATKAAKVEITTYTDGDAKWFFKDVPVHSGEQYLFSDNYLGTVPADIVARYTLFDGSYRYVYLGTSVISTTWTGYETLPFTVPKGVISLTIFHLIHQTGSLSVDNASLHKVEVTQKPLPPRTVSGATFFPVAGGRPKMISSDNTGDNENIIPQTPPSQATQAPIIPQDPEVTLPITAKNELSHDQEKKDDTHSFVGSAQAAVETPSDSQLKEWETAPLEASVAGSTELTLTFWGLLLIAFSIMLTIFFLRVQDKKEERSIELWEL